MNTPAPPTVRRFDLDALRAVAMLLGIVLHTSLSFFPSMWVVRDDRQNAAFGALFCVIHGFRMPVFFVMSGFFAAMLLRRLGPGGMLKHRFRRVFLPMLLALATIIPLTDWIAAAAMSSAPSKAEAVPPAAAATLDAAAAAGDLDAIERRLASGEDVNAPSGHRRLTPLHRAALGGRAEVADLLIRRGADVNATAIDGGTPLHVAAFIGNEAVVAALLTHGADANSLNKRGNTPLDNATVDAPTTVYFAGLLGLPVDEEGLGRRKTAIAEALREQGARLGRQTGVIDLLTQISVFGHLWFLWFLWWLSLGLAASSAIGSRILPKPRLPAWLVVSPARYLWLVPLTMIPQWFMGDGGGSPIFGPDTSSGLLPVPHVLAYYAIFFGFGALDHQFDGRVGSRWWLPLAIGLLVVFPIGMALSTNQPAPLAEALAGLDPAARRFLAVGAQAAYPWLMTFGLMGLFRRICSAESPTMRYLSDSSYWLYLAHLPLVLAAQHAVRHWPIAAPAKFVLIVAAVTIFLLMTYQVTVRYSWLGRMLNGPRSRPARSVSA